MAKRKLNEMFESIPFNILEMKEVEETVNGVPTKRFRVKGVFNRADERNSNNRIYPSKLIEREHRKLQERIADGKSCFMQADHPTDGTSRIADTVAILRSTNYDPKTKLVTGEADIVGTGKGKDLQEIIRAGGQIGISARGYGTTAVGEVAGQKGEVVQEDYQLVTYDFVVGQSTRDAVVTNFAEQARLLAGLTEDEEMDLTTLNLEALKAARPELVAQIEKAAKEAATTEARKEVAALVAEKVEEIEAKLKLEYGSDGKIRNTGEKGGDRKKAGGRGGDRGDTNPKDQVSTEEQEQMKASLEAAGYKVEKKKKKADDDGDAEDDMDEQTIREHAAKHGLTVVKKGQDSKLEQELATVRKSLNEVSTSFQSLKTEQDAMKAEANKVEIHKYILEVTKNEKRLRHGLIERMMKLDCKSKAEVDAKLPGEKESIVKLLEEVGGGEFSQGFSGKEEERGSERPKSHKTKDGTVLTEAQIRQRELAGIKTELLVE